MDFKDGWLIYLPQDIQEPPKPRHAEAGQAAPLHMPRRAEADQVAPSPGANVGQVAPSQASGDCLCGTKLVCGHTLPVAEAARSDAGRLRRVLW